MRILIIDDDEDIADLLQYNLEKQSFTVKTELNSEKAVTQACEFNPDLIILDICMPPPDGLEICRLLRTMERFENTYIFFLTANYQNHDKQAVLQAGGDDFIEKMFGLRSLIYRINSVLKKNLKIRKGIDEVSVGSLTFNRIEETVRINRNIISLNRQEFEVMFFLAQNSNIKISASDLLHNLWGSTMYLTESSIELFMRKLERKIGANVIVSYGGKRYGLSI